MKKVKSDSGKPLGHKKIVIVGKLKQSKVSLVDQSAMTSLCVNCQFSEL